MCVCVAEGEGEGEPKMEYEQKQVNLAILQISGTTSLKGVRGRIDKINYEKWY